MTVALEADRVADVHDRGNPVFGERMLQGGRVRELAQGDGDGAAWAGAPQDLDPQVLTIARLSAALDAGSSKSPRQLSASRCARVFRSAGSN
jgi:hypothetical protein